MWMQKAEQSRAEDHRLFPVVPFPEVPGLNGRWSVLPKDTKWTGDGEGPTAAEKVPAWWLRDFSHPQDSCSMPSLWVSCTFPTVLPRHFRTYLTGPGLTSVEMHGRWSQFCWAHWWGLWENGACLGKNSEMDVIKWCHAGVREVRLNHGGYSQNRALHS